MAACLNIATPELVCALPQQHNARWGSLVHVQVLESTDRPLSPQALCQLAQFLHRFLAISFERLMGMLRKELEPGLNISRHPREVFVNFLQLGRLCTAFVRLQQVMRLVPWRPYACWGASRPPRDR